VLVIVALLSVAAGWLLSRSLSRSASSPAPPVRLTVTFPADLNVRSYRLSPDGSRLVLRATSTPGTEQTTRLYTRRLDDYEVTPIAGTEGVLRFVFSPDGRWLAVLGRVDPATGERRLTKIPADGGAPPVPLASWGDTWFESFIWLDDGDLLLTRPEGAGQAIFRISTATGAVGPSRPIDFGAEGVLRTAGRRFPGQGVFVQYDTFGMRGYQTDVWLMDPQTGTGTKVVENAADAVYLSSGHLLFARGDTIMAAPFDSEARVITGELTALVSGLSTPAGPAGFGLADNGTLAYVTATGDVFARRLVAIDPSGSVTPFVPETGRFAFGVAVDDDGTRAATTVLNPTATYETWVADASRSTLRRTIALATADISSAIWSADGQSLAYYRESLDGQDGVYVQRLSGTGEPRRIAIGSKGEYFFPTSWLPDGSAVLLTKSVALKRDLVLAPTAAAGVLRPLRATPANEENAVVSDDGDLVAFASDESGRMEIYLARLVDGALGQPVPVSRGPGMHARWAPKSRRLYFSDAEGRLQSVDISLAPTLSSAAPQPVHDLEAHRVLANSWDVLADGRIVGIQRSEREDALPAINVVVNWGDEIRARLVR
jgi:hypothetical protein